MKSKILIVDGMALLFRGFYATAYTGNFMKNDEGIPTNGVQQFLRYFLDGVNTFDPSHIICCWDMGSKTFRTDIYKDYKANRGEPPAELIPQFEMVKQAVTFFDLPNIGLVNYEADDVIGSLANELKHEHHVIIQTGDYDLLQLVEENVHVAIMKKGIGNYDVYDQHNFYEKYGLHPEQLVDFKAFTGDSADNYPGVKGIGEKTAKKLLNQYHNIDTILLHKHELAKGVQTKLDKDLEMFYLSKQLATIKRDLEIPFALEHAIVRFDVSKIEQGINELGLRFKSVQDYIA